MDILIFNWKDIKNPEAGGAEVIAFEYARRLVKDGHTVTFFSRAFIDSFAHEVIDGVRIIRKGNRVTVYFRALQYYLQLRRKPDKVIDMINTLCWQTPLYISSKKRIAYVNQLAKEVFFYELPFPLSWLSYLLERFEYISYKQTDFLCYSKSTKSDLIHFGIPKEKINIFPLGVDHDRYVPGPKRSKTPLFIFVARLVKMKRADICIKAMKYVVQKHRTAKLAIIGNGPEEENLFVLIKKLGLEKNVSVINKNNFFIEKTPRDIKLKFMQEAWALLLPSVKEGWGMVVTEAAGCGTPSIVTNVTGLRDSVKHNKTGLVISKKPSVNELAKEMIKIVEDTALRERLSTHAVEWSKEFTWDKSYSSFKKLLLS